ncbi:GntR family transcriptional regulator [Neobacillus drentensis]|uniref:GntR family transcriptional regulator n=1 Tax=Neobacillus drentensis TaxID=220684 RepID=UPI00285AF4DA|nr:GntR family transcriptional regulator [Neobacillus drentensis]MDR7238858.1 GntR family transcriptional regulator [Neobacillus drentensis]
MRTTRKGSGPLYKQIADYIRQKVDDGEWSVGYQVPPEIRLCEQFNVSRITVVKALERLVEEGLLVREQGKGTFVALPELSTESVELLSFTEEIKKKGKIPSSLVLSKSWTKPTIGIQQRLKLERNERVLAIRRLMMADDLPIGIQTSYLPEKHFPDLMNFVTDNVSLYSVLREQYGTIITQAIETYRAVQLDDEEMELLEMEHTRTGFNVERLSFVGDIPVEFVRSIMRADQTYYSVKLVRKGF